MITIKLDIDTFKEIANPTFWHLQKMLVSPEAETIKAREDRDDIVRLSTLLAEKQDRLWAVEADLKALQLEKENLLSQTKGSFEMLECLKNIIIGSVGGERIRVIKFVKQISGLDLRGAKDLVDASFEEGKINKDLIQAKKDGNHPVDLYPRCPGGDACVCEGIKHGKAR